MQGRDHANFLAGGNGMDTLPYHAVPGAMPLETVTVRSPYRDTSTRRNSSEPSAFTIQTAGSLPA
jgi:hypothetical protein